MVIDATLVDVTRIISGAAGSLSLEVPKSGTRPTSDRVREAIFSSLEAMDALDGARVLDLFAGSGALGLEAASRGASTVTLVEKAAAAAKTCKRNANAVIRSLERHSVKIEVVQGSADSFLRSRPDTFDLVFVDPPYEMDQKQLSVTLANLGAVVTSEALIIVERSTRSGEPLWPQSMKRERHKTYGETAVWTAKSQA